MKQRDDALAGLVQQWLDKAAVDLAAAEQLSGRHAGPSLSFAGVVAFHCQQAVEKYVKAFLVRHQVEFPRTHDIAKLLDRVAAVDSGMAESLRSAELLTPFGVEMRYPGDTPELLPAGETEAIELALRVRDAVVFAVQPYLDSER
jgi:HEPN domain-containing protein